MDESPLRPKRIAFGDRAVDLTSSVERLFVGRSPAPAGARVLGNPPGV